jgi:hypothetical protein
MPRPQTEAPKTQDNSSTTSTTVPDPTTMPITDTAAAFPAIITTLSDGATPPPWLSDAILELGSLPGPLEWASVVAGLLALDRSLGFPSGKVRSITIIISSFV